VISQKNQIFIELVEAYFETPRDVIRFVNGFRFTQLYLNGTVDVKYLACLEVIRTKSTFFFELLRIYYHAIVSRLSKEVYKSRVMDHIEKERSSWINESGALRLKTSESQLINSFFKIQLGFRSLVDLEFPSQNHRHELPNYIKVMEGQDSLRNPVVITRYFQTIIESEIA